MTGLDHSHDWVPPAERGDHDYGIGPAGWFCSVCRISREGRWPLPIGDPDGAPSAIDALLLRERDTLAEDRADDAAAERATAGKWK